MKKFLAVLLTLVMVFAFAACGSSDKGNEGDTAAPESDVEMKYMTADELEKALAEGDDSLLVLDVRKASQGSCRKRDRSRQEAGFSMLQRSKICSGVHQRSFFNRS